ncbi:mucin-binding protein [Streptococcus sp. DAT741]|nr:MucBP domain-containing protein [Streptococcus sp. DAT741]QHF55146.1 hypothetical protein BZG42_07270 [Streptococcus sp. DAT741]
MFFNKKNSQQKNWRMIKKGKFFCYGCTLLLAMGSSLILPSAEVAALTEDAAVETVKTATTEDELPTASTDQSLESDKLDKSDRTEPVLRSSNTTLESSTTNQIANVSAKIEVTPGLVGAASRTKATLNFDIVNPSSQGSPIVIEYKNVNTTISDGDLIYDNKVIGTVTSTVESNIPTDSKMTGAETLAPEDSLYKTIVTITLNNNADKYATDHLPISLKTTASTPQAVKALTANRSYEIPASISINGKEETTVTVPVRELVVRNLEVGDQTKVSAGYTITTVNGKVTARYRSVYIIPGTTGLQNGDILTISKGPTIPFDNDSAVIGSAYILQGGAEEMVPVGDSGVAYKQMTSSSVRLVLQSVDAKTTTYRVYGTLDPKYNSYEWTILGVLPKLNAQYDGYNGLKTFNDLHVTLTRKGETVYETFNASEGDRVNVNGTAVLVSTEGLSSVYTEYYLDGKPMPEVSRDLILSKVAKGIDYTAQIKEFDNYEYVGPLEDSAPITGKSADTDLVVKLNYRAKIEESVDSKEVTRIIKYVNENGDEVAPSVTQKAVFNRKRMTNKVTGEKTYGNWETEKTVWEAINTPVLENYTTTQTEIAEKTVSPDSTDSVETVTYLPTSSQTTENKTVSRTIKYVDRDGKEIAPSTTQTVNFTRTVSTNDVTGEKTYGSWKTEKTVWEAVNTPVLENYTTTQTEIAEKTVSPDSTDSVETVTYLPTSSQTTENKTVSRTIKYVDRDGKEIAPSTTQTVNFTRTVSTNDVTGEKTYGDWETEKTVWEAVNTPVLENYTTTQTEIAEKTVSPDSTDSVETVTYTLTKATTAKSPTTEEETMPTGTVRQLTKSTTSESPLKLPQLPKTGDEVSNLSILGTTLLASCSFLLIKPKKRQED